VNLVIYPSAKDVEDGELIDFRFPLFASLFFKRIYPTGKIFLCTSMEADIPDVYRGLLEVIRFEFRKIPYCVSLQFFFKDFCSSDKLSSDTLFTSPDVVLLNPIPHLDAGCGLSMTYRNHPTRPYSSDLFLVQRRAKERALTFLEDVIQTMAWLPGETAAWPDHVALAITIGKLADEHFDGQDHFGTRIRDFLLHPIDNWLYTPNDLFSALSSHPVGSTLNDVNTVEDMYQLITKKISFRFKGPRKHMLIKLAYKAFEEGYFDPYDAPISIPPDELFREALG
jgi:hypothetical protein